MGPMAGGRARYDSLISLYRWAATPYYLSLIDWSDPDDPVRRQCIPDLKEITFCLDGSEDDPLEEERHMPVPHLIHRYGDRALLLATGICATYCRHCNRKRFWASRPRVINRRALNAVIGYLSDHPGIREVIVSGGDPLTMGSTHIDRILSALRTVKHLEVIRMGSRVPVVMPMRITRRLCRVLARYRPLWLNTHFNHPREITREAELACNMLQRHGIPVSNQTVLLKGINDNKEIIKGLFCRLQAIMVRPYYLFHCDAVRGTDHFRTGLHKGIGIMKALLGNIGGMCLPTLVVDLPGGGGKVPLTPDYLIRMDRDEAVFRNHEGRIVRYKSPWGADHPG